MGAPLDGAVATIGGAMLEDATRGITLGGLVTGPLSTGGGTLGEAGLRAGMLDVPDIVCDPLGATGAGGGAGVGSRGAAGVGATGTAGAGAISELGKLVSVWLNGGDADGEFGRAGPAG